jgi:hypothetical protein
VDTVVARAESLAPALGVDPGRLVGWCIAFAAMVGVELAEVDAPHGRVQTLVDLAMEAPTNIRS